ncbi:MAG TPA: DUF6491 family protein [Lysobacter sp.]
MRIALLAVVATAVLAGCATRSAEQAANRLVLYRAHAGEPVSSFPYLHSLTQWTPLGPSALAVWVSPTRAYLLDVGSCPDLEWAQGIRLTENTGQVSARFDRVYPLGPGIRPVPCRIEWIRPLDARAIRDAERRAGSDRRP